MNRTRSRALSLFYHGRVRHYLSFLLIGGLNTLFGYGCYAAALGVLHLPVPLALLLSHVLGVLFNFQSYGRFVFNKADHGVRRWPFIRFLVAYGAIYMFNLTILKLMQAYDLSLYLAQGLALIVVVPVSYLLLCLCVWGQRPFSKNPHK